MALTSRPRSLEEEKEDKYGNPTEAPEWAKNMMANMREVPTDSGLSSRPRESVGFNPEINTYNYFDELNKRINNRLLETKEIKRDYYEGEISGPRAGFETLGKAGFGTLLDVGGETINAALKGISFLVPDAIEEPVLDGVKDVFNWMLNTEGGKKAQEAWSNGYQAWSKYKKENPKDARMVESTFNIAFGVIPGRDLLKTAKPKGGPAIQIAETLEDRAKKQKIAITQQNAQSYLFPFKPKDKVDLDKFVEVGKGVFRKRVRKLNDPEIEMVDEFIKVPGVNLKRSFTYNKNQVDKNIAQLGKDVEKRLEFFDAPLERIVDSKGNVIPFSKVLEDSLNKELKNYPLIVGDMNGPVAKAIRLNIQTFEEIRSKYPNTAKGLFQARKEFDQIVKQQTAKGIDIDSRQVADISRNIIRRTANETVENIVPDAAVKNTLRKQRKLYESRDLLIPKALDEANSTFSNMIEGLGKYINVKTVLNRYTAVLAGTSAFAIAGPLFTAAGVGLTFAGVTRMIQKGVMSPQMKQALAGLVRMTDDVLRRKGVTQQIARDLKMQRAFVLDLIQTIPVEKEQTEKTDGE